MNGFFWCAECGHKVLELHSMHDLPGGRRLDYVPVGISAKDRTGDDRWEFRLRMIAGNMVWAVVCADCLERERVGTPELYCASCIGTCRADHHELGWQGRNDRSINRFHVNFPYAVCLVGLVVRCPSDQSFLLSCMYLGDLRLDFGSTIRRLLPIVGDWPCVFPSGGIALPNIVVQKGHHVTIEGSPVATELGFYLRRIGHEG